MTPAKERLPLFQLLAFSAPGAATGAIFLMLSVLAFIAVGTYFGSRELLMRSMMADVVLEDSVRQGTGEEGARSGTFYAMLTLTAKLGAALSVGVTFWTLSLMDFDAEGQNSTEILLRFRWLMGTLPVLTGLGVIAILWRFPINAKMQQELRHELQNQRTTDANAERYRTLSAVESQQDRQQFLPEVK